jgi:choline kinase
LGGIVKLIILAAGMGSRLRPLTNDKPKAMVEVGGRPIIEWTLENARAVGITDITIVTGYRGEQFKKYGVKVVVITKYETTNMVESLFCASEDFGDDFILSYGDIVYKKYVLSTLMNYSGPFGVVVDNDWLRYWSDRFEDPLSDAESLKLRSDGGILEIGQQAKNYDEINAQYIGLVRCRGVGVAALKQAYMLAKCDDEQRGSCFNSSRGLSQLYLTDLIQGVIDNGMIVDAVSINGGWLEIDSVSDHILAEKEIENGLLLA